MVPRIKAKHSDKHLAASCMDFMVGLVCWNFHASAFWDGLRGRLPPLNLRLPL